MDTDTCLEMLESAIRFEEEGYTFFNESASKTKNAYGKMMFEAMAIAEREHVQTVQKLYADMKRTGEWPTQCPLFENSAKNVFENSRKDAEGNVDADTDDVEAVKLAMEYETKGLRFYKELAEKAQNPVEREFYQRLIEEERGHLLMFEDVHQYYVDPVHWFAEKEHSHWDGA